MMSNDILLLEGVIVGILFVIAMVLLGSMILAGVEAERQAKRAKRVELHNRLLG